MLESYLADLEERLDEEAEQAHLEQWKRFWTADGTSTEGAVAADAATPGGVFAPRRNYAPPPAIEWPVVPINDAIERADPDLMLLRELKVASDRLAAGAGGVFNIRSNYGTGILPSLFGTELFMMEKELETLPTARPLGADRAKALLDAGLPSVRRGQGAQVLDLAERYRSLVRGYPKVARWIRQYHPDIQSPMDALEMIYGSELFLAVYDEGPTVHALLRLLTDTYAAMLRAWLAVVADTSDIDLDDGQLYTAHWGFLIRGRIMLRADSAMNFSPDMYDEFIIPYDRELLAAFGGGAMHFCGKGDHYIRSLCASPGLFAINMSQPEYNNMETIYEATVDRGIRIVGLPESARQAAAASGRPLRGKACVI